MSETKSYARGAVVFREGDPGDCMYDIDSGMVAVYHDYGGANEKRIALLDTGKVFGEMGMLDHAPRSATVVVETEDTILTRVSEEDFLAYFEKNPPKMLDVMQQLCSRLRSTSRDYAEACKTAYEVVEAEKSGEKKKPSLLDRILKLCQAGGKDANPYF